MLKLFCSWISQLSWYSHQISGTPEVRADFPTRSDVPIVETVRETTLLNTGSHQSYRNTVVRLVKKIPNILGPTREDYN